MFASAAPAAGYFNNVPDPDGLVRAVALISEHGGRHYEPLALAMYRLYTGSPAVLPGFPHERGLARDYDALQSVVLQQATAKGTQQQAIPVDQHARVRVPYRGPGGPRGGSFEYVSAVDLLQRPHRAPATWPASWCSSAPPRPASTTSAPRRWPRSSRASRCMPTCSPACSTASCRPRPTGPARSRCCSCCVVTALLVWALPRVRALRGAQVAGAVALMLVGVNLWAYRAHGLLLPLAGAAAADRAASTSAPRSGATSSKARSRRSLARLFGTYVPPELVEEMARDPARYDMRAENRELTVMFCDMRNFTRVSELLSPEDVRGLVNSFFSAMTTAIRAQRGTLDKYIGDAIMAFWGAPLADPAHAAHATRAALAMTRRLEALNAELRGRSLPEIGLGIGLNTGIVCVGDMGSSMRRSYTVMGDAVNLSSRIEGLTRHYGVDILVGEEHPPRRARDRPTGAGSRSTGCASRARTGP